MASPFHLLGEQMVPQMISPCFPLSVKDMQPISEKYHFLAKASLKNSREIPSTALSCSFILFLKKSFNSTHNGKVHSCSCV